MIRIEALAVRFRGFALEDITIQVAPGEFFCLIGPTGAGKTVVLESTAGLVAADSGSIRIAGRDVTHLPPERRRIGIVYQDSALFPHLTVGQNIRFGLRYHPDGHRFHAARLPFLLEQLALEDLVDRSVTHLSGGEKQRVALARALAPRPGLLLMDEPFSSLDTGLRVRLGTEIRDILKKLGITALLVTHDQAEAFAMADEIGVMRDGQLEQWDTAYNLYHRPASRFVAEFVGEGCFVPGETNEDGTVQIELGRLETTEPMQLARAASVEVLLRPDDVVHDDDSPQTATVLRKAFRGASILYTLGLPSGRRVLALVPSHHDHRVGERIGIRLEADHVVVFPS